MTTVIKKLKTVEDRENSTAFERLRQKGLDNPDLIKFDLKRVHRNLTELMGPMHKDFFIVLIRPWLYALQFIGIVEGVNVSDEKRQALGAVLKTGKAFKNAMNLWRQIGDTHDLYAFLFGAEIDFKCLFDILDETASMTAYCVENKNFARGKKYSKDKIQEYGVFALFHLAKALRLEHERPSKIYKFVRVVTGLSENEVNDYYRRYSDDRIDSAIVDPVYGYIYNPGSLLDEIRQKTAMAMQKKGIRMSYDYMRKLHFLAHQGAAQQNYLINSFNYSFSLPDST